MFGFKNLLAFFIYIFFLHILQRLDPTVTVEQSNCFLEFDFPSFY